MQDAAILCGTVLIALRPQFQHLVLQSPKLQHPRGSAAGPCTESNKEHGVSYDECEVRGMLY